MANPLINFIKKTYKIIIVFLSAIIFFLGYNVYLVDHSLANLRFTLDKVDDIKSLEDAKKLAQILDFSILTEVASKEVSSSNIAKLELAKDILSRPQDMSGIEKDAKRMGLALHYSLLKEVADEELQESSIPMIELAKDILSKPQNISQLENIKFVLREVIKHKESQRAPVLLALDKISQAFIPVVTSIPKQKLEKQARYLKKRLKFLKDKDELQEVYYELGNIYTQLSEFTKAKEAYRKVIDLKSESELAKKSQFNLAWNEKLQGNLDEAIKEFEIISQTADQEELSVFSQYQMADALRKKGEYEKAIVIYQQVASRQPNTDLAQLAYFLVGDTFLYDLKDYEKALEIFDRSKTQFKGLPMTTHIEETTIPSIAAQYRREGFRLLQEGYDSSLPEKFKAALKYFDKALEIDVKDGLSYTGKALTFVWLDDPDRALGFARTAVKYAPNEEIANVNLGYIYIQLDLTDEAVIEFKRFILVNPFTSHGYYNLGYAYVLQNKLEEAAEAFQKATQIDHKFIFAFNNQGWCLWQLGRYSEAVEAFEKAIQVKPDFLDALFNLGMVYKILGRYEDAQKNFQKVLKFDSAYSDAQSQLKKIEKVLQKRSKFE